MEIDGTQVRLAVPRLSPTQSALCLCHADLRAAYSHITLSKLSGFLWRVFSVWMLLCCYPENALSALAGKLSCLTVSNALAVGARPSSHLVHYNSTETAWWRESLHLFLISTRLLTPTPLQWACFQGDKHRVTQHCESCNNIVFIVGDGWNFSHFTSWSWEDMQECLSPCRMYSGKHGKKYLLSFRAILSHFPGPLLFFYLLFYLWTLHSHGLCLVSNFTWSRSCLRLLLRPN